jgi:foldase protein PrsA
VSKASRSISALGAVLFAVIGLAACGGIPGDAVVQVNGNAISKDAFNHWMAVAASSSSVSTGSKPVIPEPPNYTACIAHLAAIAPKPEKGQKAPTTAQLKTECATQYKSLQTEVLGFLISSSWVLEEGSALGVKLSDKEVHKQFEKIKNAQFPKAAEFEKFLATSGQTVSDLLLRVKLNLLSQKIEQKIVKKKSTVTEAQVTKYYNENKSRFGTPEKRSVEIILTKTEAAAKSAKKEVESGKSFASVAKAVSIDPTSKANGGLLPEVVKGEEEKALDTAIFSTAKNVLSGPVKTPFGFYVFEVKGLTPGSQQSLAQVKSSIKAQLASQGQQTALSKFVKEFKKKWQGKTECRSGFMVADCKGYKAPKGSATGAAGTGETP